VKNFLVGLFGVTKAEDAKVSFACPTLQIQSRQAQMLDKGAFVDVLGQCWPYSPFFKPVQNQIAGVTSLAAAASFLKGKGAQYLLFIDVLSDRSGPLFAQSQGDENGIWSTIADANAGAKNLFQRVVVLPLGKFPLDDFAHRRDMVQRGQELGRQLVPDIQKDLGL
jgi:NTE family protein